MTTEPWASGALPLGPRKLAKPEAEVSSSVTWPSGVTARSLFCGPSTNQRRPWRNCGPSVKPNPVATSSGLAPGGIRASSAGSRRSTEGSGGGGIVVLMGTEMAMAAATARRRSGMRAMVAQRMVASDGPKYRGPSPPLRMTAKLRRGFARLFSSTAIHGREHWKKRTKLDHCRARSRLILHFSRANARSPRRLPATERRDREWGTLPMDRGDTPFMMKP